MICKHPRLIQVHGARINVYCDDLAQLPELYSTFLIGGQSLRLINTESYVWLCLEPLVHEANLELYISTGLSVLPEDLEGVLIFLLLKEKLAHVE